MHYQLNTQSRQLFRSFNRLTEHFRVIAHMFDALHSKLGLMATVFQKKKWSNWLILVEVANSKLGKDTCI